MARTKLSILEPPPHEDFQGRFSPWISTKDSGLKSDDSHVDLAAMMEWNIPCNGETAALRRYLPTVFFRFIETYCDEL